jgi:hypothetical protein
MTIDFEKDQQRCNEEILEVFNHLQIKLKDCSRYMKMIVLQIYENDLEDDEKTD